VHALVLIKRVDPEHSQKMQTKNNDDEPAIFISTGMRVRTALLSALAEAPSTIKVIEKPMMNMIELTITDRFSAAFFDHF
jgi:hypothetical protein